jgi:hypothetical protein
MDLPRCEILSERNQGLTPVRNKDRVLEYIPKVRRVCPCFRDLGANARKKPFLLKPCVVLNPARPLISSFVLYVPSVAIL